MEKRVESTKYHGPDLKDGETHAQVLGDPSQGGVG